MRDFNEIMVNLMEKGYTFNVTFVQDRLMLDIQYNNISIGKAVSNGFESAFSNLFHDLAQDAQLHRESNNIPNNSLSIL